MINTSNGMISASSSSVNAQSPGLKTYFKTPEGRYKLQYEKTHPSGLLHYAHGKTATQVTLAHLKDKPAPSTPTASSSSFSASIGVRSAAARLLGAGNGNRALSFVGGNGSSKSVSGNSKAGSLGSLNSSNSINTTNFDGKGTYLIFNVGDAIFISDLNSQDKDPIKSIHFSNSNPVCHAFDQDAKDGHDLLIGLNSGDVYSVSLRQQLQDVGKKLVGAQHYNKDGSVNISRCASIAWLPGGDGAFVVAHADGNLYVYEKSKDGAGDSSFPVIKDPTQFSVAHARYSKSNPIARWHICQGSINNIAFSSDGAYLATVGRDGYLRVFDYTKEQLICGGKSYYGALLCCAWSMDGKYILTGGEDDLVQVWSMEDRKVVAWGEGHNSWVSGVAFDSYWTSPNSDGSGETVMYRFGSVGQDTQLLLWDLEMDEIVVPLRRYTGGSPTFSTGSQSSHWDTVSPVGTLQPAPSMRDVPKLSPMVTHRVHTEPLSGVIFTQDSVLTVCREGHIKIWTRPGVADNQAGNPENVLSTSLKEKTLPSSKVGGSSYRQ
ncbi:Transducin/WD40 repeat-like superfamily protein [Tripterygium wilfordii]|uniref:Transducin/WD40 repeat-like superfamily protein n=1 Tax=Tripterygium wilfordii TaxID=458696 RepID=A0A7J7CU66_TRIWF|nr:WD repeat-containing protein 20-like [Tripterygium wilfordii]KAF5737574.1 Transducin/WD40 repeat-like superfamily protein [Tripterygium wilfordii]